jgi:peptidoglycan glycosyltransferase
VNQSILRLFVLVVVLFAALVAWTSRWTVFEAEALRDNALNRRELLEEQRIRRGPIRARDGTLLARSVPGRNGTFGRRYPTGPLFAHPVGYSFLTVGRFGLEDSRNDALTGEDGDLGNLFDQLSGERRDGDEVRTTLDPAAQRVALEQLGGRRGAVVALEPQTGRIRVMASTPTFDPNELRDARTLEAVQDGSALNRTVLGQYPPGSTFKVVTAVAAIDSGRFEKESQVSGESPKLISGAPLNNFGGQDFGLIPLTTALTQSVNTVWAEVGETLGGETMQRYMERFGFYDQVPVDLPPEERGRSGVRIQSRPPTQGFVPMTSRRVDVGRVAIGQGGLLATPLQMAMVASAVANEGRLMRPVLTDRIVDRDGRTIDEVEPREYAEVMRPSTARAVGDMMANVVREGTGTAAALAGASVAGKTGTAELNVQQRINQPWFIAFAPRERPRIAIAATVERCSGCFGGTTAAPIARAVLQELLR